MSDVKEKANYPKKKNNKNKIELFLAFQRKAKIQVEVQGLKSLLQILQTPEATQHLIIRQSSSEIPNKNNEFH